MSAQYIVTISDPEIQALLAEAVSQGIPAISLAVATRAGEVCWCATAGTSNVETVEPLAVDTPFGIGSITKTLVAWVILQLTDEGKLSLESNVADLLGDLCDGVPNADRASVAQLLNHTGGVPSWEDDPLWIRQGRGVDLDVDRLWGKADTLEYIKGHAPLAQPGEKYSYSNTNYTLLGLLIEKITGAPAESEIRRRILQPLGLTRMFCEGFEPSSGESLPRRYHWATPEFRQRAGINAGFRIMRDELIDVSASNLSVEWLAGGYVASAIDLASLGLALRAGRLLSARSAAFTTQWLPVAPDRQVGYNLRRRQYSDLAVIGHDGDVLGFSGTLCWIEGHDLVVAMLCNLGSMHCGLRTPLPARSEAFLKTLLRLELKR